MTLNLAHWLKCALTSWQQVDSRSCQIAGGSGTDPLQELQEELRLLPLGTWGPSQVPGQLLPRWLWRSDWLSP